MISKSRRVSHQVLLDVNKRGTYPNLALADAFRKNAMYGDDKALTTHIVYGTLQRQLTIDALLQPHITRSFEDLDAGVLTILRMTVYQLCFLSKVPTYAAIHEAVELCKTVSARASGFVNGVLRSFTRDTRSVNEKLEALISSAKTWDEQQSLKHSFPRWIVKMWREMYGAERTEAMLVACNEPAHLTVRVNRLRADRDTLLQAMNTDFGAGAATPSLVSPDGILLRVGFDVDQWDDYKLGRVSVQDEAAMLVAPLLGVQPRWRVLDMCAAPGTKTAHIAELSGDEGDVVAVDIHPHKVRLMDKAFGRLGLSSVHTKVADATLLSDEQLGQFDAVLLDAPCSGLGVLRHRPDIRWRRSLEDVSSLAALQKRLLKTGMSLVKPGGVLVYSTCTVSRAENEQVIAEAIQSENGNWWVDDVEQWLQSAVCQQVDKNEFGLTITPEQFGTDGFFMTRLRKQPGDPTSAG